VVEWTGGWKRGKHNMFFLILTFLNNEKHIAHLTTNDVELGAMAKEQRLRSNA
jgi:hypothetical protein